MNKKERTRETVSLFMNIVIIGIISLFFYNIWYKYYRPRVFFWQKGNWLILGVYFFSLVLFNSIFGGFRLGYAKTRDLIFSQTLALGFANIIVFIETIIARKVILPVGGFLGYYAVEIGLTVIINFIANKIYYFNINGLPLTKKDAVIVETERGEQYGIVKTSVINIDKSLLKSEVKSVLRKANNEDEKQNNTNLKDSVKAMEDCEKIKDELGLDMKILSASFTFDRKQLLFNFLADDRVDFRELAKRLASIYKTRIELRQIGVRDKAKEIGGYGQCGRKLCCHGFLDNLNGVSINMAKNQNLALNPEKINGVCGRLMCCLAYENESYFEYKKDLPRVGEVIKTKEGTGKVIYVDLFAKKYKIETEEGQIIDIEK